MGVGEQVDRGRPVDAAVAGGTRRKTVVVEHGLETLGELAQRAAVDIRDDDPLGEAAQRIGGAPTCQRPVIGRRRPHLGDEGLEVGEVGGHRWPRRGSGPHAA